MIVVSNYKSSLFINKTQTYLISKTVMSHLSAKSIFYLFYTFAVVNSLTVSGIDGLHFATGYSGQNYNKFESI